MLIRLECPAQNYAWGKVGLESTVAQLSKEQGAEIDENAPYAELWMGTHPNGPSKVVLEDGEKQLLADFLKENPEMISTGEEERKTYGDGGLPYLFKVLSVNTALSIQAHPDKKLAEQLHADRPNVYKDPNHKPEMACAITDFEALCGFLPLKDTVENILATPELEELLNESPEAKKVLGDVALLESQDEQVQKNTLKTLFSSLMQSDPEKVKGLVDALEVRLSKVGDKIEMPNKLALRLCGQYPGDVGVFCAYFLCYRVLKPGMSCFLGANEPHAYLSGDCAEIMACSDNVVRAGLTPKFIDVPTLCSMLTYRQPSHSGAEFHPGNLLEGKSADKHSSVYSPPDPAVTEFQMERVKLSSKDGEYQLKPSSFGSIILVLSGNASATASDSTAKEKRSKDATEIKRGDIFFQPAGSVVSLTTSSDLLLFRSSLKGAF